MRLFKVHPRKGFRMDDSRWIKWFAIATAVLTAVLVFLTIVLARYASRLDVLTDALVAWQRSNQPSSPTPEQSPTPTACAYTKGNTHSYPEPYAVTKSSAYASASPASTPPPIARLNCPIPLPKCRMIRHNSRRAAF